MKIDTLQVIKNDGTVVQAIGIEESSTTTQLSVPLELFSLNELKRFGGTDSRFSHYEKISFTTVDGVEIPDNSNDMSVFIGESECYHLIGCYDNFNIETRTVEIPDTVEVIQKDEIIFDKKAVMGNRY